MLIKLVCKPLLGLGWDWTGGSVCLYPWVWRHIPKPVLLTSTPPADDPMRPAPVTHPGRTSARSAPDRGARLLGASSPASSPRPQLSRLWPGLEGNLKTFVLDKEKAKSWIWTSPVPTIFFPFDGTLICRFWRLVESLQRAQQTCLQSHWHC